MRNEKENNNAHREMKFDCQLSTNDARRPTELMFDGVEIKISVSSGAPEARRSVAPIKTVDRHRPEPAEMILP
jgi:hypothetical protein